MKKCWFAFVVISLLLVPIAQGKQPCTINTITGTYALEITGSMFFGNPTSTPGIYAGPFAGLTMVGEFTIDAAGHAKGFYWMASGVVNTMDNTFPWEATFLVNEDCTGEIHYNALADNKPMLEKLAILQNGAELRTIIHGIGSPSMMGAVWESTAWRIARLTESQPWCTRNSLVGDYVVRCAGWDIAPNGMMLPSMMLGQASIAADGSFTGSTNLTVGPSTISDLPISGTFALDPNCTVSTEMTLGPLGTVVSKGVFYNNGKDGIGMPMYHLEDPANHHSVGNKCVFTRSQR